MAAATEEASAEVAAEEADLAVVEVADSAEVEVEGSAEAEVEASAEAKAEVEGSVADSAEAVGLEAGSGVDMVADMDASRNCCEATTRTALQEIQVIVSIQIYY
jgi:hypothetical protein